MPDGRIQQTHAAAQRPERRPDLILPLTIAKPMRAVGGFFALALDTMVQMFKPPLAFREFLLQTCFIARACTDCHAVDSVHRHRGPGL
jgi:ABC-type transporter Mla maintaining outer membrane lipid asymmetry permease subunit MlaE